MPNGFSGRAATRYLTEVNDAHSEAASASRQTPVATPRDLGAKQMPFSPGEAKGGSFITGKGNSSNIVADRGEYEEISHKISEVDDRMGHCLFSVAQEIEAMCQSAYKLPWAVPRCLNISNGIKSSLGEFRSLTEEATQKISTYARDITEIE